MELNTICGEEKSFGSVIHMGEEALTIKKIDKWLKFRSKIFYQEQYMLLDTLTTNISKISG